MDLRRGFKTFTVFRDSNYPISAKSLRCHRQSSVCPRGARERRVNVNQRRDDSSGEPVNKYPTSARLILVARTRFKRVRQRVATHVSWLPLTRVVTMLETRSTIVAAIISNGAVLPTSCYASTRHNARINSTSFVHLSPSFPPFIRLVISWSHAWMHEVWSDLDWNCNFR